MKFGMFDVREKGASGMIAHGQDDVGVGRNLTFIREYICGSQHMDIFEETCSGRCIYSYCAVANCYLEMLA